MSSRWMDEWPFLLRAGGSVLKNTPTNARSHQRCRFNPWVGKIPRRRKWQTHSSILASKSHGQRSHGLWSRVSRRVGHDWSVWAHVHRWRSYAHTLGSTNIPTISVIVFVKWQIMSFWNSDSHNLGRTFVVTWQVLGNNADDALIL